MNKKRERLFDEFPKIDTKEWENIILQDLKGADYAKRLLWKTDENITVKPYYRSEDLNELGYLNQDPNEFPFLRGTKEKGNDWRIAQRISETNPQKANAIALELISKGATALFLNAKEIKNSQDLAKLLDKIDLETIALRFENHFSYTQLTEWFLDYVNQQHIDKTKVTGSFDYDPITYLLLHNKFWKSKEEDLQEILYLQQNIGKQLPNFNYISSNGNILHNCGTTIVQELAYSLAIANEYIVFATE
ncbi:MAG: hypothetical protein GX330_04745, partial [Bacteroidales bacterium]|nr:hypothetical protein [Bacteroidales bacterium]